MRLQVRHATGYRYDTEVLSSYNEARLVPQTGLTQLTLSSEVTTHPDAQQQRYWDYWGTQVTAFDVHVPHTELQVTCTSVVDTSPAPEPGAATWEELEAAADAHVELPVGEDRPERGAGRSRPRRDRDAARGGAGAVGPGP
jgi:transglutaminase-like putative cysteine protease